MYEMVETLAFLGQREREEMLSWYEDKMPREISKRKRDVGILQLRWMVEKKIEENQGMLKEEVTRDGVKKGSFQEKGTDRVRGWTWGNTWGKHSEKFTWETLSTVVGR